MRWQYKRADLDIPDVVGTAFEARLLLFEKAALRGEEQELAAE